MSVLTPPAWVSSTAPDRADADWEAADRRRILGLSTTAVELMFAVWLVFGVLGIPHQGEFGLSDVQLSWLS